MNRLFMYLTSILGSFFIGTVLQITVLPVYSNGNFDIKNFIIILLACSLFGAFVGALWPSDD